MDGAGPFRTLISVIIPQSWPVIIAVGIFHFVYSWNNFFEPLIYLTTQPELLPLAVGLQRFNGIHSARAVAAPGRHVDDADHPGARLHRVPALLHSRRRHHRRRALSVLRVALTFDIEHPDRPTRDGVTQAIIDTLAAANVRATMFLQGRWVQRISGAGTRDRGRRTFDRQPLTLSRSDADVDCSSPGLRRADRDIDHSRRSRSRPAALVPLSIWRHRLGHAGHWPDWRGLATAMSGGMLIVAIGRRERRPARYGGLSTACLRTATARSC